MQKPLHHLRGKKIEGFVWVWRTDEEAFIKILRFHENGLIQGMIGFRFFHPQGYRAPSLDNEAIGV